MRLETSVIIESAVRLPASSYQLTFAFYSNLSIHFSYSLYLPVSLIEYICHSVQVDRRFHIYTHTYLWLVDFWFYVRWVVSHLYPYTYQVKYTYIERKVDQYSTGMSLWTTLWLPYELGLGTVCLVLDY